MIQLVIFWIGFFIFTQKLLSYLMQKRISFPVTKKQAATPFRKLPLYKQAPESTHGRACKKCIASYTVDFPFEPYPAQVVLMFKILKGLREHKNSLLESPTGTGKSLALLCSTLAWQLKELEDNLSAVWFEKKLKKGRIDVSIKPEPNDNPVTVKTDSEDSNHSNPTKKKRLPTFLSPDDSDDDFRPVKKQKSAVSSDTREIKLKDGTIDKLLSYAATPPPRMTSSSCEPILLDDPSNSMPAVELSKSFGTPQNSTMESPPPTNSNTPVPKPTQPPPNEAWNDLDVLKTAIHRTPKIYYGTRTHQQIKQIVRELASTSYRHTPMTILASREHLCVNSDVLKSADKAEGCKEAVKLRSCPHYIAATTLGRQDFLKRQQHLNTSWDIEDLVTTGRKNVACPYYATRYLLEESLIVFCPYNYLIDPIIKREMKFSLDGQIVVLDEAHNIENISREAASTQCTQSQLEAAVNELDSAEHRLLAGEDIKSALRHLSAMLVSLNAWVCGQDSLLKKEGFETFSNTWLGVDIVKEFGSFGLSHSTMQLHNQQIERLFEFLFSNERSAEDEGSTSYKALSSNTITLLEWLFEVFNKLLSPDGKYTTDYIVFITKKIAFPSNQKQTDKNRWLSTKKRNWERTINFCCLNPAVAFSSLTNTAYSIILTSGTLTPMTSFVSELGCDFQYQATTNHVIKPEQVWIGLVGTGPNDVRIEASYRGMEQLSVQDEIGGVLVSVCERVPDGVLCFLPSYSVMDKLKDRWDTTGVTGRLCDLKHLVWEPRGSGKASTFKEDMSSYFESITSGRGGLLVGVCRGKVSEGIDFADAQARAVMCVGIPFPNFKDLQVQQKKEYNDRKRRSGHSNLLSGSQWYEVEAFRALNQALGRCIRHKNDWGSIILCDARFSGTAYLRSLSKWAREKALHFHDFKAVQESLTNFITARTVGNVENDFEMF